MAVSGEADASGYESVTDFFLATGAVYAVIAAVVVRIDFANGDYEDVFCSCPGHDSADMRKNSFMVSNTSFAIGKEEILLGVYIHEDLAAFSYH